MKISTKKNHYQLKCLGNEFLLSKNKKPNAFELQMIETKYLLHFIYFYNKLSHLALIDVLFIISA